MGQVSARDNHNPYKGPALRDDRDSPESIERSPRLLGGTSAFGRKGGGRESANQVGHSIGRFRFREGPTSIQNFGAWPIEPHEIVLARRRRQQFSPLPSQPPN